MDQSMDGGEQRNGIGTFSDVSAHNNPGAMLCVHPGAKGDKFRIFLPDLIRKSDY